LSLGWARDRRPSLNIYGHASNLLAGLGDHANCAVLIGLSVLGKFTCDDSSLRFSLSQGGKPLPLRVVNREVLASDWKEIKYAIPVKASPGHKADGHR
jgi:hypothetical protein